MKVSLIQADIEWVNSRINLERFERLFTQNASAQLYILPEMFSTGFITQPEKLRSNEGNIGLAWMQKMANTHSCALAGSLAVEDKGRFFNRFYFVYPNGEYLYYDKRHLFTYGGEDKAFTSGKKRVIANYLGIRILLQICYDLRFPVASRNRNDYDMIIYVASWPASRIEVWNALLVARAIENQCYVAGVNRVGNDPSCAYSGGTQIISPYGKVLKQCPANEEGVIQEIIDIDSLLAFRKKFPVLRDSDDFIILGD